MGRWPPRAQTLVAHDTNAVGEPTRERFTYYDVATTMSAENIARRRRARTCAAAAQMNENAIICQSSVGNPVAAAENRTTKKTRATHGGTPAPDTAPRACAFGMTFVLAPSFSLRLGREDAVLLSAFSRQSGLAILIQSECQVTARTSELLNAELLLRSPETMAATLCAEELLHADASRLLSVPNAGGASRVSEAMSIEVLARAFGARLLRTETEIVYFPRNGAITDFTVELEGVTLGVSVTRAITAPGADFGMAQALQLLEKKLQGVIRSTASCCGAWEKQVLHVWSPTTAVADVLEMAYALLDENVTADTVVLISVCEGLPLLFREKACALPKVPRLLKGLKESAHMRVLQESDPCRRRAVW